MDEQSVLSDEHSVLSGLHFMYVYLFCMYPLEIKFLLTYLLTYWAQNLLLCKLFTSLFIFATFHKNRISSFNSD